jgi:hypothetical protein
MEANHIPKIIPATTIKKRGFRLSEAEKLAAVGYEGSASRYRKRRDSLIPANEEHHIEDELEVLTARARPTLGEMAEPGGFGIRAAHERPRSRGFLHWRHDGELPPAETVTDAEGNVTKVFTWRGLFKNVRGRSTFVPGVGTSILRRDEAELDFWDRVRIHFLRKKYGHLGNLCRTWHTSKNRFFSFLFLFV